METTQRLHDQVTQFFRDLHVLRLSGGLSHETIIQRLQEATAHGSIVSLECHRVEFHDANLPHLWAFLHSHHRWTTITLGDCSGRVDRALAAMSGRHIKTFTFNATIDCDPQSYPALASLFRKSHIEQANIRMYFQYQGQVLHLIQPGLSRASRHLKTLSFRASTFLSDNCVALCDQLATIRHVRTISLVACKLSDMDVARFVRAAAFHPSLSIIHLDGNSCKQATLGSLAQVLIDQGQRRAGLATAAAPTTTTASTQTDADHDQRQCKWNELTISYDGLSEDAIPNLQLFFESLQSNRHLTQLTMTEYMITERDMLALTQSLQTNRTIRHLSLFECGITATATRLLGQRLAYFPALQHLRVPGDDGVCLLQGLQHNTTLLSLDFPSEYSDIPEIDYLLDLNRGGRRIIRNLGVPSSLWPHILHRADQRVRYIHTRHKRDVLYHLLSKRILLER